MKKILFILMTLAVVLFSCNDYETYGDKKEKERNAIAKFIADSSIVVISEDQFKQQGMTTDVKRNEFVKFDKNGVYMQIVRSGCGTGLGAKEQERRLHADCAQWLRYGIRCQREHDARLPLS